MGEVTRHEATSSFCKPKASKLLVAAKCRGNARGDKGAVNRTLFNGRGEREK